MKCHGGSCDVLFYLEPGTKHAVVCEMYSTGTEQQKRCFKEHETGAALSNRAGISYTIGSVAVTLVAVSYLLSVD